MKSFLTIFLLASSLFAQTTVGGAGTGTTTVGIATGTTLIVIGSGITGVQVTPGLVTILNGATQQFSATYQNANGPVYQACIGTGWASSNTAVATIDANGNAHAVGVGTTTISCTSTNPVLPAATATLNVENAPIFTTPPTPCSGGTCSLPNAANGIAYSYPVAGGSNSGGTPPYSFSKISGAFPTGFNALNSTGCGSNTNCNINGTSTTNGTYTFTLQICDSVPVCQPQQMSITVNSAGTYSAYTGSAVVNPPNAPNFGGLTNNGNTFQDTTYPSGQPSTMGRCTDSNTRPDLVNDGSQAGLGGFADDLDVSYNSDIVRLEIPLAGSHYMVLFNPNGPSCGKGITQDKSTLCPGKNGNANCSSSSHEDFGPGNFSVQPVSVGSNEIYTTVGASTDSATNTQVLQYSINPSTGAYSYSNLGDVSCLLPLQNPNFPACQLAPAWQATHSYPAGTYISYTITPATWAANTAFAVGDIIITSSTCAFLATVDGGLTGATEPTSSLNSKCANTNNLGTVTESCTGTCQKWRFIGSGATFIYQNVGATGTSSGSVPCNGLLNSTTHTTQMPNGHPDVYSMCNDGANIIWENVGPNAVTQWESFGGAGLNDNRFTAGFSNNNYGNKVQNDGDATQPATNCSGTKCKTKNYNQVGSQNTGFWIVSWDLPTNVGKLYNSATGWQSTITCSGGSANTWAGCQLGGGTVSISPDGVQTDDNCRDAIHSAKSPYGNFVLVGRATNGIQGTCGTGPWFWNPFQTFNATTSVRVLPYGDNHWAMDYNSFFIFGPCSLSTTIGIFDCYPSYANIESTTPPVTFVANPCGGAGQYPCTGQSNLDSHLGRQYNPSQVDGYPALGSMYPVLTFDPGLPTLPDAGETVGVTTSPTIASPYGSATGTIYRFAHLPCWMTNNQFSVQFMISEASQDGKFVFTSCDGEGQFGTTDGTVPFVCSSISCPGGTYPQKNEWVTSPVAIAPDPGLPQLNCIGGPNRRNSYAYSVGNYFQPIVSTSSGGNYDTFQVITAGTSASSLPTAIKTSVLGQQITDGTAVIQDIGPGNCKGEVLWLQLK